MNEKHRKTAQSDKIPFGKKLAYGMGGMNDTLMNNAFHNIANPILNMTLHVSPTLIAWALFIPNLWNAFSDPICGHISDQARFKKGRRLPFLIPGALVAALALIGLWGFLPEGLSNMQYFWITLVGAMVFFTGTTIFLVPYNGLGFEMTGDYHERTRLMFIRSIMANVSGLLLPWIAAVLFWDGFSSPLRAVLWLSAGISVVFLLAAFFPAKFCEERLHDVAIKQQRVSIWAAIKETLQNKPFLIVLCTILLLVMSYFTADLSGQYLIIYYMFEGVKSDGAALLGMNGTINTIVSLAAIPLATWLSLKIGKRHVIISFMLLAGVGAALRWFLYTPGNPYLIFISTAMIAPGFSALWLLIPSLLADVCDYEELKSGRRAEGTLGAMYSWVNKLAFSLAFLIANLSLDWVGFDVELNADQTDATFLKMRMLFVLIPAIGFSTGALAMWRYSLTEKRMYEIKAELETRRAENK